MPINPTPAVHSPYGAPMGRPSYGRGSIPTEPFILRRIPLNNGGYDRGGAYWGVDGPLYWYCSYATEQVEYGMCKFCACGRSYWIRGMSCKWSRSGDCEFPVRDEEIEISDYIRADSREHAKELVRRLYPEATFKR